MDWFREHMWETWLGLAILFGVAEMIGLELILLMLAVGALVGMALALVGLDIPLQVLGFAVASVAMLGMVRPNLIKRLHSGPDLALGHGKLVGRRGIVTEAITADDHGRIKLDGEIWSAAPYDEFVSIAPGEAVEVLEIRGATAYVHAVPRLES